MNRRHWLIILALGVALGLLSGCRFDGSTLRVNGHLFTIYSMPRKLRPGPVQIGLRVQDPDYRILTNLSAQLTWTEPETDQSHTVAMKPGPGKDYRAKIVWTRPGVYVLRVAVTVPDGSILSAVYRVEVPAR